MDGFYTEQLKMLHAQLEEETAARELRTRVGAYSIRVKGEGPRCLLKAQGQHVKGRTPNTHPRYPNTTAPHARSPVENKLATTPTHPPTHSTTYPPTHEATHPTEHIHHIAGRAVRNRLNSDARRQQSELLYDLKERLAHMEAVAN